MKQEQALGPSRLKPLWRWLGWLVVAALALQLFFLARIALMAWVNPQSTAFQRSQFWQLATSPAPLRWRQTWVPYARISDTLKRAVIASEDDNFVEHDGVEWDAIEKAWQKNARQQADASDEQRARRKARPPKIYGGSTITQQLAKNLLLSGERSYLRKAQEFVLALMLEALLSKERILEIYLNSVEWGVGVFGAEAAARHYFQKPARELSPLEAARLAVMLPRPKYFEKLPNSAYLAGRARAIAGRMAASEVP